MNDPRAFLRRLFDAAIAAADPARCLPPHLPKPGPGRTLVIGAGKAAARMAQVLEQHWSGPLQGLVITRYGHAVPTRHIEVVEAGHPLPDQAGERAARRILERVRGLSADDQVIALISGGGSALLALPAAGLTLAAKQTLSATLLRCGASIGEINTVRRHLSAIKGGRLAAACHPARVLTLMISDVPGDHPFDIASGPTQADPSTRADALAVLERYAIDAPAAVLAHLNDEASETLKPGDARLAGQQSRLIASPRQALQAAAQQARSEGVRAVILGDDLEGEARDLGQFLAAMARSCARHGEPFAPPCVLLSGGETSVTVRHPGRGGRNVECLLALGLALGGQPGVHALAGDTDGVDGSEEIAGAIWTPDTLTRAAALGLNPRAELEGNNAHSFFAALGDSVITGPTLTNVNDFRAVFIDTPPPSR